MSQDKTITIGRKTVGDGHPAFIIAELSANHAGSLQTAKDTIYAMKEAGADAVKLQTYRPDTITLDVDTPDFTISQGTVWDGRRLSELYAEAMTPWEWHGELFALANSLGMEAFSSPFDFSAVDFLQTLDVPAYKIASFEITDIPLIEYVASKGRPVIISTGVATLDDINEALKACSRAKNDQVALLKCTSAYPASPAQMNLSTIEDMRRRFGCVIGLSDHTETITTPVVAVSLGAKIIEKHFILDRGVGGPDAAFSLEPKEFGLMTAAVREAELLLGEATYELGVKEQKAREFCRSLYVCRDIAAGEELTSCNIKSVRPAFGLHPRYYYELLGRKAAVDIKAGKRLDFELLAPKE